MHTLGYFLVAIHIILGLWSIGGFLELTMPHVFWKRFANPEFPDWLLVFHWGSVLFASLVFLFGYFKRWDNTPQLMAVAYGFMALVCVVETFGFMTNKTKYLAMGAEYAAYIIILIILYRSRYFMAYFTGQA